MHLKEKLERMKDKTWLYKTRLHKVVNTKVKEDTVLIVTNLEFYEFPIDKAEKEISQFLPVEDEEVQKNLPVKTGSKWEGLKTTVYDLINDIKNDPKKIPQAKAVNEAIRTLVDMTKTEIEIAKLTHKIKD